MGDRERKRRSERESGYMRVRWEGETKRKDAVKGKKED